MFDIGFSELLLVMIVGLVVLGPKRLPIAVKTVTDWIRAMRSLATSVQNELAHEFKLQELQDNLKKVQQAGLENLSPELKASMSELQKAAEALQHSYTLPEDENRTTPISPDDDEALHDESIHNQIAPPHIASPLQTELTASSEQQASESTENDSPLHRSDKRVCSDKPENGQ